MPPVNLPNQQQQLASLAALAGSAQREADKAAQLQAPQNPVAAPPATIIIQPAK